MSPPELKADGTLQVSVDVSNAGKRDGAEIVQLYVRDLVGSSTRPVKQLAAFEKVPLAAGETKTVTFTANKPGVFPYYCTNFGSALHQEMQGYIRVSLEGSNVQLTYSTGNNLPKAESAATK